MRPMTLWEAVSAFRDDRGALDAVFGSERWRAAYFEVYKQFSHAIAQSDQKLLETPLPVELTREIAARCHPMKFNYFPSEGILQAEGGPNVLPGEQEQLSAVEVHDRFGGWVIEEVLEFGSANLGEEP